MAKTFTGGQRRPWSDWDACPGWMPMQICVFAGHTRHLSQCMTKPTKMTCAPCEDLDQPGNLPSLIRVFAVRMNKAWVFSYPLSAQPRLIRLDGCPGWSESSLGGQVSLLVLLCTGWSVFDVCFMGSQWQILSTWRQRRLWSDWVHGQTECPGRSVYLLATQVIWASAWQNQQSDCAPCEDLDQPGHPPSLIRVFAVRMNKAWVLSYLVSTQRRLIRLDGCPGWPESSLGGQVILLVLSCTGWLVFDVCFMDSQWQKLSTWGQRRLWSDGCPGWSESSLGGQVILLVLSCTGWLVFDVCFMGSQWQKLSTWGQRRLWSDWVHAQTECPGRSVSLLATQVIWASAWQNQQSDCEPYEDLDQPGHPPSLIRVFAVRMNKAWVLSYPLSAQRRLIRLDGCPGWSESSLGALVIWLVLLCGGSFSLFCHAVPHLVNIRLFWLLEVVYWSCFVNTPFLSNTMIFILCVLTILSHHTEIPCVKQVLLYYCICVLMHYTNVMVSWR